MRSSQRRVVLLPGLQGSAAIFGPLLRVLPTSLDVEALDLPNGSPKTAARALHGRLSGMGPCHMVTGSYGGLVALQLPADCLHSLAMVGTSPNPESISRAVRTKAHLFSRLPRFLGDSLYRKHLSRSLADDGVDPLTAAAVCSSAPSSETLRERLKGALQTEPAIAPSIPLAWVRGEEDSLSPWDDSAVQMRWPGVNVVSAPGKHRPWASHPEAFAGILLRFWGDVDGCPDQEEHGPW